MIQIKKFTATEQEFIEIARIRNLINHDSIDHPDEDKNDWKNKTAAWILTRLMNWEENCAKFHVIDVSQQLGEAIRRILEGGSLSDLF